MITSRMTIGGVDEFFVRLSGAELAAITNGLQGDRTEATDAIVDVLADELDEAYGRNNW